MKVGVCLNLLEKIILEVVIYFRSKLGNGRILGWDVEDKYFGDYLRRNFCLIYK